MFLDISLLVYSVCHHLSSLRSVGAFTFVFRAKHIQLNKKVCCFLGLYRVSHLARRFYWQGCNWESDILSYPHNRYTPCCSLLYFQRVQRRTAQQSYTYSTHSVARLLTHGCLKLFGLENITHQRHLNKKERKKRHHFSTVKPRFKKKIR